MSNRGTEVQVVQFPSCDFCDSDAQFDGKTVLGSWGYMCSGHFKTHGTGLGTGRGQKIVLKIEQQSPPEPVPPPSMDELEAMVMDGDCYATDGCPVEPDGVCPHGCKSWLLVYGLI